MMHTGGHEYHTHASLHQLCACVRACMRECACAVLGARLLDCVSSKLMSSEWTNCTCMMSMGNIDSSSLHSPYVLA